MTHLRFGIVQDVDKGKVKVRFEEDDLVSDWLPVSVPQTKSAKIYHKPVVGEHVYCIMDEHMEYGVVGGSVYSDRDAEPNNGDSLFHIEVGAFKITIADNKVTIANAGGSVVVEAGQTTITPKLVVDGDIQISGGVEAGNIHSTGDIKSDAEVVAQSSSPATAVHLSTHVHTGVIPGGGTSAVPLPGS